MLYSPSFGQNLDKWSFLKTLSNSGKHIGSSVILGPHGNQEVKVDNIQSRNRKELWPFKWKTNRNKEPRRVHAVCRKREEVICRHLLDLCKRGPGWAVRNSQTFVHKYLWRTYCVLNSVLASGNSRKQNCFIPRTAWGRGVKRGDGRRTARGWRAHHATHRDAP